MATIERIELPTPFEVGTVNCYAIISDGVTLVDPGPDAENTFTALDAALDRRGYNVDDVDRVLVTHEHMDHFGGARRIQKQAGAEVLAHHVAVDRIADPAAHLDREQAFFVPFLTEMGVPTEVATAVTELPDAYAEFRAPVRADRALEHGDTIHVGGESLAVVHVPGHAPGQVCFVSAAADLAFTADHVLTGITPNPLLTLAPNRDDERTRSLPDYLASLDRLLNVTVERGLGGHRKPIPDLHARVRETVAHHEERKQHVADRLEAAAPVTAYDLMGVLFPDLPTTETFPGMAEVIGHLDLLEDEGRAEPIRVDEEIRYRPR